MVVRILSIVMIVLGAIGLVISGTVYSIAGNGIKDLNSILVNTDETIASISKTLNSTSEDLDGILGNISIASETIFTGIDEAENYLLLTSEDIQNMRAQLELQTTLSQDIESIGKYLRTTDLPLNKNDIQEVRTRLNDAKMTLASNDISELRNFLNLSSSVSAGELVSKLEELSGNYAILEIQNIVNGLDQEGIKFTEVDGWLQIDGPDVVTLANVIEATTLVDMSLLRENGLWLTETGSSSLLAYDQVLSDLDANLSFIEQQKEMLSNSMTALEEILNFATQQKSVIANNLFNVADSIPLADNNLELAGQTLNIFGNQLAMLNSDLKATTQNLSNIALPSDLKIVSENLDGIKLSQLSNLISSLLKGLTSLMAIGSILFILAGLGIFLIDKNINGNRPKGIVASQASSM